MTIPDDHPRRDSLLSRQRIVDAQAAGLLADSALIAHGRGEAFDYLIGERTTDSAKAAQREALNRLFHAKSPVISLNGNSTVLAGEEAICLAALTNSNIEVNIFYRTDDRMRLLLADIQKKKNKVIETPPSPKIAIETWREMVESVRIYGENPDAEIPGLHGPRASCSSLGIFQADVVMVPLEDGDRCEALVAMGKQVLVIDLNPLSRTSMRASVTIVDEVSRAIRQMVRMALHGPSHDLSDWNNRTILEDALSEIATAVKQLQR